MLAEDPHDEVALHDDLSMHLVAAVGSEVGVDKHVSELVGHEETELGGRVLNDLVGAEAAESVASFQQGRFT